MKNKLFAIILIFSLFIPKAKAEEQVFDYEHLIAGSCITRDGFFFTEEGMVNLLINTKEKIRIATLDGQKQVDLLKIDLKSCSEAKEIELRIQKDMYEKQLKIKQDIIDSYKVESHWANIKIVGGVVAGLTIGVLLTSFISLK